jgi:hypothetical protein
MKSGDALRSPDNDMLTELAKLIPRRANGVKVEYDISYNIPKLITGYKYTDFLTTAVYIAPNSHDFAKKCIIDAINKGPTDQGWTVFQQLAEGMTDKYILDNDDEDFYETNDLVILPGTNLLVKEVINMELVDQLVTGGAMVKLHPITSKVWQTMLTKRWGAENIIPADAPLYPTLRRCEKVYFPMSSESGFSAVLLGKKIGTINSKGSSANFEFIYRGMDQAKSMTLREKLAALLSHPESGIFTVYHNDLGEKIAQYFKHMEQFPHENK